MLSQFPGFVVVCKSLSTNSKPEVNPEVHLVGKEVATLKSTHQHLYNLELLAVVREQWGGELGWRALP